MLLEAQSLSLRRGCWSMWEGLLPVCRALSWAPGWTGHHRSLARSTGD